MENKDQTYLAKWLSDELSPEALEEFKKSPEYQDYEKIRKGLDYFQAPSFDQKQSLETTLQKARSRKKSKVIALRTIIYSIGIAASILLLISLFFNTVSYTAKPAEQLAIVLPDGSTVTLNAASTLTHRRFFWSQNRAVTLDGEAVFEINHGTDFTVATQNGTISVLGTTFNVRSRNKTLEVACYTGKVGVYISDHHKDTLTQGETLSFRDNLLTKGKTATQQPLWTQGESRFKSTTLREVLYELERQYQITFVLRDVDEKQLFTGGFVHNDLKLALRSVLIPMHIKYEIKNATIVLWNAVP